MKDFDKLPDDRDQIAQESKVKHEYKPIHTMRRPHKGMKLWCFSKTTGEMTEVKAEGRAIIGLDGKAVIKKKVELDQKGIYIWAINKKNAFKKLDKYYKSIWLWYKAQQQKTSR